MEPESRFQRLRNIAAGDPGEIDGATLPPEIYEAWKQSGTRFGKFVLLGELGRGGTGIVHRAWQHDLRREVALKVVSGLNPELRERFMREARIGARLAIPAVLTVFEMGEEDGTLWLTMPLVKGRTLDEAGLGAREAALCVAAAARGVQAAHEAGVVHRDLKPRNMMLDDAGQVVVMDFGLALAAEEATRISVTGQVLGTPHYMAPEQAAGGATDARTDVYGLGATLYRMLTGRAPYSSATLQEFLAAIAMRDPDPPSRVAAVPHDLETIVLKAMERDAARRYASAAAFADDLERFAAGDSVEARRASIVVLSARRLRRHWVVISVALIAVAVGMAGVIVADRFSPDPPAQVLHPAIVRGRALQQTENLEKAITEFETVSEGDSSKADALKSSAECRIRLRLFPAAAEDLKRVTTLRPDDAASWSSLARCLHEVHDYEAALTSINRAIKLKPGSAEFVMQRAQVQFVRQKLDLALADYDLAVQLQPDNVQIRTSRAYFLVASGRFGDAIRDFDVAIEKGGRVPELLKERGRAKNRALDFAGALKDLKEAVELDPHLKVVCEKDIAEAEAAIQRDGEK